MTFKVGDYFVLSRSDDAPVYRVTCVIGYHIQCEDLAKKDIAYVGKAMMIPPSDTQMNNAKARGELPC